MEEIIKKRAEKRAAERRFGKADRFETEAISPGGLVVDARRHRHTRRDDDDNNGGMKTGGREDRKSMANSGESTEGQQERG